MSRRRLFSFLALLLVAFVAPTAIGDPPDEGPPISITSPDTGSTYAFGEIKSRSLYWRKKDKTLIAQVTFSDVSPSEQTPDDTLEFRLPGITLDEAKGIFYATTAKGDQIPIAHYRKSLFVKSIEVLPNARVRIIHVKDTPVTVILEAISPNDPAMHAAAPDASGTRAVSLPDLFK